MPPLHIKLGLCKTFVMVLNKDGEGYSYIRKMFISVSDANVKASVFTSTQIRKLLKDNNFEGLLNVSEKNAWVSFKLTVEQFLGNNKFPNYVKVIDDLIEHYEQMGCRMSLKLKFLHSHLNLFPENLVEMSDEHGERFHQKIMNMEQR